MTLEELVEEVEGYGFQYEPTNRIEKWIQRAYSNLNARYNWPWTEETKEGKAPLELKDLRYVLSVTDSTQERPLWGTQRQWLLENYPKLNEEGNPVWWFLDNLTLRLFPLSTSDTIVVRYVKKLEELKAEKEPLIPAGWQSLIVDTATIEGYKRNSNIAAASEMKELVDATFREMVADQLQRDWQGNRLIVRTGYVTDYL